MNKEINLYKIYSNELNQLFFILNLKYNNSNSKFSNQFIESNSLFSNIKFFIDEIKNKNDNSLIKNNFVNSMNFNSNKSISSYIDDENEDDELINKIKEMNYFEEFLEEKFNENEKFKESIEKN